MELVSHNIKILELIKANKFNEVFKYVKDNNLDPSFDNDTIADYAAIWVDDNQLVGFFKELKKIGGEPTGHRTIINNVSRYGKLKSLSYLISEGGLKKYEDEIVYIINNAMMGSQLNSIKLLDKHIDLMAYKLLDEVNPSIINRIIDYPDKKILDYLFKENMMQSYVFSYEVLRGLENTHANQETKNYFIKKVANSLGLKNHNKYISQEQYKPGDTAAILKTIQYDALGKDLKVNNSVSKVIKL